MSTTLVCECGFETSDDAEADVVAQVRTHAWEQHRMRLSIEDARELVRARTLQFRTMRPPDA